MDDHRLYIIAKLIIAALFCFFAGTTGAFAQETGAPETASSAFIVATPVNVVEIEARVTQVLDGGFVMLDRGSADGIATTTMFTLFRTAETVSADGTATRTERFKTGELKAAEVSEKTTRAEVVKASEPPAPGMTAVFLKASAAPRRVDCRDGSQFVAGGEFNYSPGSLQRDVNTATKGATPEKTADFCIDVSPAADQASWTEANAACAALGGRLCTREEQHRACMTHNRKPLCKRGETDCPRGEAIEDFTSALEWSAMWMETPPGGTDPEARTGS